MGNKDGGEGARFTLTFCLIMGGAIGTLVTVFDTRVLFTVPWLFGFCLASFVWGLLRLGRK